MSTDYIWLALPLQQYTSLDKLYTTQTTLYRVANTKIVCVQMFSVPILTRPLNNIEWHCNNKKIKFSTAAKYNRVEHQEKKIRTAKKCVSVCDNRPHISAKYTLQYSVVILCSSKSNAGLAGQKYLENWKIVWLNHGLRKYHPTTGPVYWRRGACIKIDLVDFSG